MFTVAHGYATSAVDVHVDTFCCAWQCGSSVCVICWPMTTPLILFDDGHEPAFTLSIGFRKLARQLSTDFDVESCVAVDAVARADVQDVPHSR